MLVLVHIAAVNRVQFHIGTLEDANVDLKFEAFKRVPTITACVGHLFSYGLDNCQMDGP